MVFSNNLLLGAGGQGTAGPSPFDTTLIGNSVWLDGSADFLKRDNFTLSADGKKEFIFSMWIQRNEFGRTQTHFDLYPTGNTNYNDGSHFLFQADDQLEFSVGTGGSSGGQKVSSAMYRDVSWYHVLISYNTNAAIAAASRHRLFVNGLEISDTSAYTAPPDNQSCIGSGTGNADLRIGRTDHSGIPYPPNAYFAQACYLEGKSFQAGDYAITDFLDSFTFGTNGSQFVPKADADIAALASTVGGNSFCLDFANSADLGNDISSNNNDFTPTSMTASNQTTSSPSSAFATWNPLRVNTQTQTFAEGNLRFSSTQTSTNPAATGNYGVSSGKFYWEVFVVAQGNTSNMIGICDVAAGLEDDTTALYASALMYSYEFAGTKRNNNSSTSYGNSITTGDIVGVALDMDNGGVYFSKNGTFQASGDPTSGASLTNAAFTGLNSAGSGVFQPYYLAYSSGDGVANFGQSPTFNGQTTAGGNTDANGRGNFKHSVPSGYTALTSANITEPSYQGIDYFAPTLYEGNGTGQRVGEFVPFTDAFNVANSAMFQHDEARALSRTAGAPSSSGGKKGTWSTWYKTANIDTDNIFFDNGTTATNRFSLQMDASGQIVFMFAGTTILMTNADLKGGGLWRNLVLKVDTSLATASARAIMYIDGVEVTSFATDARASLTQDGELGYMDSGATQFVGSYNGVTTNQWDGYLAETIFLDNQFLSADSFGQLDTSTNKWVPKAISGLTLGDQGFYLAYGGNFGTGNGAGDSTGNSNNLTEIGTWVTSDQFSDTPTKNFPTFDPTNNDAGTLSEGNTKIVSVTNNRTTYTTMPIPATGKWYWEVDAASYATGGGSYLGLVPASTPLSTTAPTSFTDQVVFETYSGNSTFYGNSGGTTWCNTPGGNSFLSSGDVLQFAYDASVGTLFIGNNNTWYRAGGARDSFANATTVAQTKVPTGVARRFIYGRGGSYAETYLLNFGQMANTFSGSSTSFNAASDGFFVYAPPTGYKALNQDNLDDTASKITAWAWIKNRDATDNHILIDRVRGVGNDIQSNDNSIQVFNANTVQRFLQRGVQIGSDVEVNTANESYVLWQWLLGDSATTGSTTSPAGSLASTSIVADADHFSVVSYTGSGADATVGHGLGAAPTMVLIKPLDAVANWLVWHEGLTSAQYFLNLNTTGVEFDNGASGYFKGTAPNATVITMNGSTYNVSTEDFIAYCFRSVAGVCKVGSYVGNLNDNGPYVSTGFKPAYVMIKSTTTARDWVVFDTSRDPINLSDHRLDPSNTGAEFNAALDLDILSDGFKFRSDDIDGNGDGVKYIYLAMADIGGNGTLPPVYGR